MPGPRARELLVAAACMCACHSRGNAVSLRSPPSSPAVDTSVQPVAKRIDARPVRVRTIDGSARVVDVNGWSIRVEPAEITAAVGDHVAVAIHFTPRGEGLGEPTFAATGTWFQPDAENMREVATPKGTRTRVVARPIDDGFVLRGVLLVGPGAPAVDFSATFVGRQQPGSLQRATVHGPHVVLEPPTSIAEATIDTEIVTVDRHERQLVVDVTGGILAVVVRSATAVVAEKGRPVELDCDSEAPHVDWVVRRIDGRMTAIGFVDSRVSDVCSVAVDSDVGGSARDATNGRRQALRTAIRLEGAGAIDIVLYRVCAGCHRSGIDRTAFAFELP